MSGFSKIDLFPEREVAPHPKKLRIVLAIWARKVQNTGSIGCPPDQQAAGAGLVVQVRLAPDVPHPAELYRYFEGSNRAAAAGAELL
jgi:hypothetical protein